MLYLGLTRCAKCRNPDPAKHIYINQSIKHPHNATNGKGGLTLGQVEVPTLAARAETWGTPQL